MDANGNSALLPACVWVGRGPCWWSYLPHRSETAGDNGGRCCRHAARSGVCYPAGTLPCFDYRELPEDLKQQAAANVLAR